MRPCTRSLIALLLNADIKRGGIGFRGGCRSIGGTLNVIAGQLAAYKLKVLEGAWRGRVEFVWRRREWPT